MEVTFCEMGCTGANNSYLRQKYELFDDWKFINQPIILFIDVNGSFFLDEF